MVTRKESDSIGTMEVPVKAYYGVQTLRAKNNFHITSTAGQSASPLFRLSLSQPTDSCLMGYHMKAHLTTSAPCQAT